ncbi:MAG: TIGR01777 family oxidoreductase [Nitrospiraceae bacterium]|nr:MAG: TIGR01777 family oxidoreductase [Nitrospiraceae bacterium]
MKAHKIAMSGASGFVGTNLTAAFEQRGWKVIPLGRADFRGSAEALARRMEGADCIVNLAGAPITGRWTEEYKKILYESRVHVTRSLVQAAALMKSRAELFISASAIGYYAADGTHTEEDNVPADDFLGHLAHDWEAESHKAVHAGMRTVIFRFGVVLGKGGGALSQMVKPFRMGLGGTIGDGSQAFSWVHMEDLTRAFVEAAEDPSYEGVYNLTAPNPTTNRGLTGALGKALGRPIIMRVPAFVLRLQLGEGAQVLIRGQKVLPKRLLDRGFSFHFQDIEEAVRDCIA